MPMLEPIPAIKHLFDSYCIYCTYNSSRRRSIDNFLLFLSRLRRLELPCVLLVGREGEQPGLQPAPRERPLVQEVLQPVYRLVRIIKRTYIVEFCYWIVNSKLYFTILVGSIVSVIGSM